MNSRTSFGLRSAIEYISPYGSTQELPIFEKLFLGGEYSIRGFDIRSVGPRDPTTQLVHRRQQEPAVQRGVSDLDCGAGAPRALL